ncbi:hypothetical protein D9M70_427380 [compost metagenome]
MQALEHHVEDRRGEVARRQADQRDGAAAAGHADALAEGAVGNRRDQHAVGAADVALDHRDRVFLLRVHRQRGAELARQFQLGVIHIHRRHVQAHGLRVLHGDMAEPADAGDRHPLAGARPGFLEALVHGDARAEDRRDLGEADLFRQDTDEVGVRQHIFGITAVYRIAGVLLLFAEGFPAGQAVFAAAAGGVQPGHADAVAFLHPGHPGAHRGDVADALVPGNERQARLHRPVALGGVQVGVADAGRLDLHQHLPGAGQGDFHFLDPQRFAEGVDYRGFHGLGQGQGHLVLSLDDEEGPAAKRRREQAVWTGKSGSS